MIQFKLNGLFAHKLKKVIEVQESARDQNNFGLRVEQPPLSDVVNKAIVFELSKIGKKIKTTKCRTNAEMQKMKECRKRKNVATFCNLL